MDVSNPDRVIFPEPGLTKADLVGHYERVGERMLDFVAGRPLTLQRFPSGVQARGFMQKNAADYFPDSIGRFTVPKRAGGVTKYAVVDRAEDLAYLANQGTITFHMWTTTAATPDRPDWMIIDLDPVAGDIGQVRLATRAVGDVLGEFDVSGFPLATGSKGFHVWVPLDGTAGQEAVSVAARAIAGLAVQRRPDALTTEFLKKNRGGRVFVDWLRNGPTATVVAPFSLRPRSRAPVAVPLTWSELEAATPDGWTLDRLGDRLGLEIDCVAQQLPAAAVAEAAREAGVDIDTPHDRFGRER